MSKKFSKEPLRGMRDYYPSDLREYSWIIDILRDIAERYGYEEYETPQIEPIEVYEDNLPKSRETYGLIHQDAHAGNFFLDEKGEITFFDFDDCAYSWFMNDIAIVLFYLVLGEEDQATFTREFMTNFLRGYREENQLGERWLREIPSFLKLREIDLYAVIHRSFDVENIDHPWVAMYMEGRKERIENEVPFIEFDFSTLTT